MKLIKRFYLKKKSNEFRVEFSENQKEFHFFLLHKTKQITIMRLWMNFHPVNLRWLYSPNFASYLMYISMAVFHENRSAFELRDTFTALKVCTHEQTSICAMHIYVDVLTMAMYDWLCHCGCVCRWLRKGMMLTMVAVSKKYTWNAKSCYNLPIWIHLFLPVKAWVLLRSHKFFAT